jgi:hypothetical protein
VSDYTLEDRKRGLAMMAYCAGSAKQAAELLRHDGGRAIPARTLNDRKTRHAADYAAAEADQSQAVTLKVAAQAERIMLKAGEAEERMIDEINRRLDAGEEIPAKELPAMLRNVTTSKALQNDKVAGPIRGRPNVIVEHTSADDLNLEMAHIMKELAVIASEMGVNVEDLAEVADAELVEVMNALPPA